MQAYLLIFNDSKPKSATKDEKISSTPKEWIKLFHLHRGAVLTSENRINHCVPSNINFKGSEKKRIRNTNKRYQSKKGRIKTPEKGEV